MQSASKFGVGQGWFRQEGTDQQGLPEDRKSTRLNSSHGYISYAVFCLKKKNRQVEAVADTVLARIPPEVPLGRSPDVALDHFISVIATSLIDPFLALL